MGNAQRAPLAKLCAGITQHTACISCFWVSTDFCDSVRNLL